MTTFNCTGNSFDTFEDIPDEVLEQYDSAAEAFLEHECGAELGAPGKTGMGHVGVVSSDFWCDECGTHYTAAEARTKARKQ